MAASHVNVLDRSLSLIELLATSENGMSIADLSARSGLPKSTVHRILATYAEKHYVEKNAETSIYFLGYKFVELASLYLNKLLLKTEAAPIMHEVSMRFNATSYLGVLENNEVMYLERTDPFSNLRMYTQIGKREPLYCTALGKVLMSALSTAEFEHIASGLSYKPYTPNTHTSYEVFAKDVALAREKGYAVDHGEHTEGSSCLAVPVYDYTRKVMAAMSISTYGLLDNYSEKEVFETMRDAAMELSKRMGYTKPISEQI